jgi:hypothetical protein
MTESNEDVTRCPRSVGTRPGECIVPNSVLISEILKGVPDTIGKSGIQCVEIVVTFEYR